MADTRYYLTDYDDEIVPCDCTLAGWAEFLDETVGAADGATFDALALHFEDDIIATRTAHGWKLSREPTPEQFVAVRFGEGLGWSSEYILHPAHVREWLREQDPDCEDTELLAVANYENDLRVTFRADPPRLEIDAGAGA